MPGIVRYGRWVALAAAIGLTAPGEHELMTEIGTNTWLAWLAPVALGIYSSCAFRSRRRLDVGLALALMILAQSLAHLLATHEITRSPGLVILVVSIYPVVLWRIERVAELFDARETIRLADAGETCDVTAVPEQHRVPPERLVDSAAGAGLPLATSGNAASGPAVGPTFPAPPSGSVHLVVPAEGDIRKGGASPERPGHAPVDAPAPKLSRAEIVGRVQRLRVENPELTQQQVAARVGCSDRTVRTCLTEAGVAWERRRTVPQENLAETGFVAAAGSHGDQIVRQGIADAGHG